MIGRRRTATCWRFCRSLASDRRFPGGDALACRQCDRYANSARLLYSAWCFRRLCVRCRYRILNHVARGLYCRPLFQCESRRRCRTCRVPPCHHAWLLLFQVWGLACGVGVSRRSLDRTRGQMEKDSPAFRRLLFMKSWRAESRQPETAVMSIQSAHVFLGARDIVPLFHRWEPKVTVCIMRWLLQVTLH